LRAKELTEGEAAPEPATLKKKAVRGSRRSDHDDGSSQTSDISNLDLEGFTTDVETGSEGDVLDVDRAVDVILTEWNSGTQRKVARKKKEARSGD